MENKNFRKIMTLVDSHPNYSTALALIEQQYMVKIYKITELNSISVTDLYHNMQKKFYINRKKQNEEFWYENQLRIFIWLLFAYLCIYQKTISELNEDDWNFFSSIFNFKSTVFFQFQALSVIKNKQRPPAWSQQETAILQQIMSQTKYQNRWNSIARQLYIKSGKRFFRNPKQCRQRWMNHLDPSKIRTAWTQAEDLILVNTIKKKGKKWSIAVKELSSTRTEHMVKNRYKSLISNQCKKYPEKRQSEIQNILIKRLAKAQQKPNKKSQIKIEENQPNAPISDMQVEPLKREAVEEIVNEDEIKVEEDEDAYPRIEYHNLNEELQAKSPIHIPWRTQVLQNYTIINLSEDERGDLENNHFYGFESEESFLRF